MAAHVQQANVDYDHGIYRLQLDATVDLPIEQAWRSLLDYQRIPLMNKTVNALRQLPASPDGNTRLELSSKVCVPIYCAKVRQTQTMYIGVEQAQGDKPAARALLALIDPAQSDFHAGHLRWRLESLSAESSRLYFSAELEPSVWLPPLVGPWMVKKRLVELALDAANGLERVAAERQQTNTALR